MGSTPPPLYIQITVVVTGAGEDASRPPMGLQWPAGGGFDSRQVLHASAEPSVLEHSYRGAERRSWSRNKHLPPPKKMKPVTYE